MSRSSSLNGHHLQDELRIEYESHRRYPEIIFGAVLLCLENAA